MRLGRAVMLVCGLASGCDRLFALTHVPDPPADAYVPDAAPPCAVNDVSMGQHHGCVIVPSGDVYCWGSNGYGQVQPGGPDHVLVPTKVPLPAAAAEIVAGKEDTCARIDGDVFCWGDNTTGQLGKGPADTSNAVRKIEGIPPSAQVAIGGGHICSRSAGDGAIWCWGRNRTFQTAQGSSLSCQAGPCTTPAQVPGIVGAKRVIAGHNSTCVIDAADQLFCWGRNRDGQLGIGIGDTPMPTLVPIAPPVREVDMAGKATCAIDGQQRMWCMGEGENGQIGDGGFQTRTTPVQVFVNKPTQITANGFGACAITEANALSCWGSVHPGDGTIGTFAFPRDSAVHDLTKLTGHYYSFCGIANGGVLCWGENPEGQLGRGARGLALVPQSLGIASPTALGTGEAHGCAIANGTVQCWGANSYGESGDSIALVNKPTPTPVTVPISSPQFLATFNYKTCVWGGGEAACWGRAFNAGLGTGSGARALPPTKTLATNVLASEHALAIGREHVCFIDTGMAVKCFGKGTSGQLGDSSGTDRPTGTTTTVITPVDQIVAGNAHTCARKTSNEIWCWGANDVGQVGDNGATTNALAPKNVNGVGSVVKIGAGEDHTCSLNTLGEVWCWGRNNDGQLGNGQRQYALAPQRVIQTGATDLVLGPKNTCAKVGSDWKCWGRNERGQLCTGNDDSPLVPTTIQSFANATKVALGNNTACTMTATDIACAGELSLLGTGDNAAALPKAPMLPGCQ